MYMAQNKGEASMTPSTERNNWSFPVVSGILFSHSWQLLCPTAVGGLWPVLSIMNEVARNLHGKSL